MPVSSCVLRRWWCLLLAVLVVAPCISGVEHYSAVSELRQLLVTEAVVLHELQDYVANVMSHLESLKSEIDTIQTEHRIAAEDPEGYLSNPVNGYRLIKRLHNDWPLFEETVGNFSGHKDFAEAMQSHRKVLSFPGAEDIEGAVMALVQLQDTYQLNVAEVASGILNGVQYGNPMTWQDCYQLGENLYRMLDFNHTVEWLRQSMQFLDAEAYGRDEISLDFYESIVGYYKEMGHFESALQLINHIVSIAPQRHTSLQPDKYLLQQLISDGIKTGLMHEVPTPPSLSPNWLTRDFHLYERVCRGEMTRTVQSPATAQRPLHCRYYTNNRPYRLLHPFKMEELNLEPRIMLIHEALDDDEMRLLKRLAQRRMKRSMTLDPDGTHVASTVRTSKNAWLATGDYALTERMMRQVEDFSSLSSEGAEEMQLANYGIGGHYEPHWDFFANNSSIDLMGEGNRISTAIYYLSDVEEGGGTAFPYLGLLVKPTKGSALFWYNLHESEEPDYRTRHGSCRVLHGSKWIANIWLRSRSQLFARPCGLQPDHAVSASYRDYTNEKHPVLSLQI